jgi:hypothetical protein
MRPSATGTARRTAVNKSQASAALAPQVACHASAAKQCHELAPPYAGHGLLPSYTVPPIIPASNKAVERALAADEMIEGGRFGGQEHGRASAARLAAIPAGESPTLLSIVPLYRRNSEP